MRDHAEIRIEIARLGRREATRRNEFSRAAPCRWGPLSVTDPRTGMFFTNASAWHFICDLLESDHPFEVIALRVPPGQIALTSTVVIAPNTPEIYIKVQLSQGMAWGRSFHYSDANNY